MTDRVLMVGINEYPGAALAGCVPDVRRCCDELPSMALFSESLSFRWDELDACTDERATAAAILVRLNRLITQAQSGDRIVFWFSGHGAQIVSKDPNGEIDGYYETLCPVDFSYDKPQTHITDKDLFNIFGSLPNGIRCWIVLDSCFSGGMDLSRSKDGSCYRHRTYPLVNKIDYLIRQKSAVTKHVVLRSLGNRISEKVAIVGACLENQTAADAVIDGAPNGAFTYYFWESVLEHPRAPLIENVDRTHGKLAYYGYSQVPTITGPTFISEPFLAR